MSYQQIVTRAWADPEFKARLLADPGSILAEHGLSLPAGVACKVVEDTPSRQYFVLPEPPGHLSDDELDAVAGGDGGVTLSPNVLNLCSEVNERGGLQFNVPAYAARNMPLPEFLPANGSWNQGPPMWHTTDYP